jgi:Rod binding domain-containing protein
MRVNANKETVFQSLELSGASKKTQNGLNKEKMREIKLRGKCKELEAVFLTQLFKVMEKTIPKSSNEGSQNTLSSMMFSSVMGQTLADQGGIGLMEIIYESLKDKDELPTLDELKANDVLSNMNSLKLFDGGENE